MPDTSFWEEKKSVLVVDDSPDNLTLISQLLKDIYQVKVANSGERALKIARADHPPDLILLDIMMPVMSGYEVCQELKSGPATADIPIIFLTAMTAAEDEKKGFDLGAVDYITKPISPPIVLARVKAHLHIKATADFLKDKAAFLESEVTRRTREVVAIQDVTTFALASLAETRDNETGNHIRRTQFYVRALAEKLRERSEFAAWLTPRQIDVLFKSAPLHDIGKVGIPDRILLKPGRLDPDEYEIMKTHAALGKDAIARAEQQLGKEVEFLSCAKQIAWSHHERWDGKGYPRGLSGADIPLAARLMSVADVYDALISKRVYKDGMPHEKAMAIILEGRGTQFDPDAVDTFAEIAGEFQEIAARFGDSDHALKAKAESLEQALGQSARPALTSVPAGA
jgi:putative two-component system response regulator